MRYRAINSVLVLGPFLSLSLAACSSPGSTPDARTTKQGESPATDSLKPPLTPSEERARIHREFAGSGPSTALWTKAAGDVFTRWKGEAKAGDEKVQYSAPECFSEGCLVSATYPSMQRFLESSRSFSESAVFQDWPGIKYRSPPEILKDGKVAVTWGLFQPIDTTVSKRER